MITCSFNAPHDPNVVPSPYYEHVRPGRDPAAGQSREPAERASRATGRARSSTDLGEPGLREFLRIYYASVKLIDDQVGRMLAALEAAGRSGRHHHRLHRRPRRHGRRPRHGLEEQRLVLRRDRPRAAADPLSARASSRSRAIWPSI